MPTVAGPTWLEWPKKLSRSHLQHFQIWSPLQLMAEIWLTTWDGAETLINNGINYQPKLVIAGFQPSTVSLNSRHFVQVLVRLLPPEITEDELVASVPSAHLEHTTWRNFQAGKRYKGEAKASINARGILRISKEALKAMTSVTLFLKVAIFSSTARKMQRSLSRILAECKWCISWTFLAVHICGDNHSIWLYRYVYYRIFILNCRLCYIYIQ